MMERYSQVVVLLFYIMPLSLMSVAQNDQGIDIFFNTTSSGSPVDLVVIMDRSQGVTHEVFHEQEKQILKDILKHHVDIHDSRVRLAVITFAKDVRRVIDGITVPKGVQKYELFSEPRNLWENHVKFINNQTIIPGTYVDLAYAEALDIFRNKYRANQDTVKNYLFIACDGSFTQEHEPDEEKAELLALNVKIFSMRVGYWSQKQYAQVRDLASHDDFYADDTTWKERSEITIPLAARKSELFLNVQAPEITCDNGMTYMCDTVTGDCECRCPAIERLTDASAPLALCQNPVKTCDSNPCQNGGTCHTRYQNTGYFCICDWGYSGYNCEVNDNDCAHDLCANGASCVDHINRYECLCVDGYCGNRCLEPQDKCQRNERENDAGTSAMSASNDFPLTYIIVATAVGGLLVILAIIAMLVCLISHRRKIRKSKTAEGRSTHEIGTEAGQYDGEEPGGIATLTHGSTMGTTVTETIYTQTYANPPMITNTISSKPPVPLPLGSILGNNPPNIPQPPKNRPDLLRDIVGIVKQSNGIYQNVPEYKGMEKWCDYFTNLMVDENLKMCVTLIDGKKYIATHKTAICNNKDLSVIGEVLHAKQTGVELSLRRGKFTVQECDGYLMTGRGVDRRGNERAICIGKSRQYFIVAEFPMSFTSNIHSSVGYHETKWMRQTIKNQGQ